MSSQRHGSKDVVVVIGPGQIGQAIARRIGVGKHVVLADLRPDSANAAAEVMSNAGYDVSVTTVDVSSRETVQALVEKSTSFGEISGLIHAAGVSPSQASPATILKADLYGTALVLEEFGNVIAQGGAGVVIASQSGHRLPPLSVDQNKALATTPVKSCWVFHFFSSVRSRTLSTRISCQSEVTLCEWRLRPCVGANEVHASTQSALGSS